jgi:Ni/Fe-hydrogenase subunit HybB-like protein
MWEKAIRGPRGYYIWILILLGIIGFGFTEYLRQLHYGLGITGMSRDVSWGLYVGQLTYLVGVAASAVMVVLPYYLHNHKVFSKVTILGEFIAVPAVIICILSVTVDLGRPDRVFNVLLHPTPNSILFWDVIVLNVYMLLNMVIGWTVLAYERRGGVPVPMWTKVLIYISIPWAFSIHTVTAFLYAGLPGRGFWLSAVMAPRFLASAFAAGPSLLIMLALLVRKIADYDVGDEAIRGVAKIVAYAMVATLFLFACEIFTIFYSQIPDHKLHFEYLMWGLHGHSGFVPLFWVHIVVAVVAMILLVVPKTRNNFTVLPIACAMVFISLWLEKGLALIVVGFIPSPLEQVTQYVPTFPEAAITVGAWAIGALVLTLLYKVAIGVKREASA